MSQKITKSIIITGTHLTPALELIRQLKSDSLTNWSIFYIGRKFNSSDSQKTSIESTIIPKLGIKYFSISCGKFDRRYLPNTIKGIPKTIKGFWQAKKIIKKIKPDIVVSFGGYVSVPIIINSWIKHIPSITHEQTLTTSLTTKINSFFVTKIALSFKNQNQINNLPSNKVNITGNLLRYELFTNNRNQLVKTQKPIIYITAGNQGSHYINMVIKKAVPFLSDFFIIHQTGKTDFSKFKYLSSNPNYSAFEYIETKYIGWVLKNSDIIISRSGANTSQEIVAFNQKSILIPLPQSQQNEQFLNAKWVKDQLPKKTIIFQQNQFNSINLQKAIKKLKTVKSTSNIKNIKPNLNLLNLIHEII
ncbi:MAG: UDP-N-acetylglucosamine--N-acetylmuramyl-(pentapeptide) pyrophosphoryl-undecaprenol N-acetylglucosamine transferase [Candidatus Shapirobacteria bacterium]|nr:UDP-N-acetylglucosamine--N-acetylmuramyl-(pentapeptide) pyrophosphoryl-undecaprenol N-acetylglucosamine transferase [Candidatus Shapirobacteria bacterium]